MIEINNLEDDLRTVKSETVTQLESFQSQQNQVRATIKQLKFKYSRSTNQKSGLILGFREKSFLNWMNDWTISTVILEFSPKA